MSPIPLGVLASGYVAPAGGGISPDDITTGQDLWWKADAITGLSNGQNINSMVDSFGVGNPSVVMAYAAYRPGQANGLAAGEWNGTNTSYLRGSGLHQLSTEQTLIYVLKPDDTADMRWLSHRGGTGYSFGLLADNKWSIYNDGTVRARSAAATMGAWQIVTFVSSESDNEFRVRVNGTEVTETNGRSSTGTGQYPMIGSDANSFDGMIAEIIRYTAALSGPDVEGVEAYLADKYAITI